jgi:ribosomal protein S18 acetylase RimI-like enzyme
MPRNDLVIIREYRPADCDAAARALTCAARQAYAFFGWDRPVSEIAEWIAEDPKQWTGCWVAEAAGSVMGFMALRGAFLDQLFVMPEWQRAGLGSRLMAKAKILHPARLELECAQQNFPARAFYERQGFIAISHGWHESGIGRILYRWHGG